MAQDSTVETAARAQQWREDQARIEQLRQSGDRATADLFQEQLHVREMAGLSNDVYLSAREEGEPPPGWTRVSADPEKLIALGVNLSQDQIRNLLQPTDSGFRAEIYIPDPAVFGPDAKPVLAFKGTAGEIINPDGSRRQSSGEDFISNVAQGMGMQSDYYDRAMHLATTLSNSNLGPGFEITGHSLAGGMASAASAVTGIPATTFNAAGLHPETAKRYCVQNGLPVYDPQLTVRTYQIEGEILGDAQSFTREMGPRQQAQMGLIVNEAAALLQAPGVAGLARERLLSGLPENTRDAANGVIDRLVSIDGKMALQQMPLAAGEMRLVPAMMRNEQGQWVQRPREKTFGQVLEYGQPILDAVSSGAAASWTCRTATQPIALAGRMVNETLDISGDVAQHGFSVTGKLVTTPVRALGWSGGMAVDMGGEVLASGREVVGHVQAFGNRAAGEIKGGFFSILSRAASWVGAEETAARWQQRADDARADGRERAQQNLENAYERADAIRQGARELSDKFESGVYQVADKIELAFTQTGKTINATLDAGGRAVQTVGDAVPATMGAVCWVGATGTKLVYDHTPKPGNALNIYNSASFGFNVWPAMGEAVQRHSIQGTVMPSLDYGLEQTRATIDQQLQRSAHTQDSASREGILFKGPLLNEPAHPDFGLYRSAQMGVYGIDASFQRTPTLHSDQLAGTVAVAAKAAGIQAIAHVALGQDRQSLFASTTADVHAADFRFVSVNVIQGMNQPLSVSTQQIAQAQTQSEQKQSQEQQRQMTQQHDETTRSAGVKMG